MHLTLTSQQIALATSGEVMGEWNAHGVSIDSRTISEGELFIALKGEHHDGHTHVHEALNRHAAGAIVERRPEGISPEAPLVMVEDSFKALWALARWQRGRTDAKMIGITGSVGKTSVCQMLQHALKTQGKTFGTKGNLNNHFGLPLMLCNLPLEARFGVFELGMNHAGELTELSGLLQPDIAIITGVESVHLEFFASENEIADAKAEIFDGVTEGGTAILNTDSRHFKRLQQHAYHRGLKVVTFGEEHVADVRLLLYDAAHQRAEVYVKEASFGHTLNYTLGIAGKHQAINSLAVLAAVHVLGGDMPAAAASLENYGAAKGRGQIFHLQHYNGVRFILLDDSYNASPVSMRAAFDVLRSIPGANRRIAVLGDMLELGAGAPALHAELAESLHGVDQVFTAGLLMQHLFSVLEPHQQGVHKESAMALLKDVEAVLEEGDVVLVKGSNGSRMWELAQALATHNPEKRVEKRG
ncbi:MAG: UDP-N-acetylmuramoyl-tripeptide--D-alanyl-D-alanine ligase [Rickettsiales bacterium]|nr:UDP-N-acetylmuramoyl-tripeptide--D-alanyl-D-alanine ligase [Rickettsiales bacterium]